MLIDVIITQQPLQYLIYENARLLFRTHSTKPLANLLIFIKHGFELAKNSKIAIVGLNKVCIHSHTIQNHLNPKRCNIKNSNACNAINVKSKEFERQIDSIVQMSHINMK